MSYPFQFSDVLVAGILVSPPVINTFREGTVEVAEFSLAINSDFQRNGKREEAVTFLDIAAFDLTITDDLRNAGKGDLVRIEGRLKQDRWTNEKGEKRSRHTVVCRKVGVKSRKNKVAGKATSSSESDK